MRSWPDPRFTSRAGRLEHADEVDAYMLPWLLENDKMDIFKAGQESGLGFSFVATMEDILEMEQLLDRDYFVEVGPSGGRTAQLPWRAHHARAGYRCLGVPARATAG